MPVQSEFGVRNVDLKNAYKKALHNQAGPAAKSEGGKVWITMREVLKIQQVNRLIGSRR